MSEYIVDTFGIVQDFADLHGDMSTPLYRAIMNVMLSRQHEEIVRCRDCRWAKPDHSDHEYRGEYRCNMWIADVDAYGFCFRAIRKEGGE